MLAAALAALAGLAAVVATAALPARPVLFPAGGLAMFCVLAVSGIVFTTRLPAGRRGRARPVIRGVS